MIEKKKERKKERKKGRKKKRKKEKKRTPFTFFHFIFFFHAFIQAEKEKEDNRFILPSWEKFHNSINQFEMYKGKQCVQR